MPEVCASAAVYRRARPAAAATPRKGRILRRETNFDSISEVMFNLLDSEVMFNLLDFDHRVIVVRHLLTALIRTRPVQQWERVAQNSWNGGRSSHSSTA